MTFLTQGAKGGKSSLLYLSFYEMLHPGKFVFFHAEMVGKNVQFMSTNPRVFFLLPS